MPPRTKGLPTFGGRGAVADDIGAGGAGEGDGSDIERAAGQVVVQGQAAGTRGAEEQRIIGERECVANPVGIGVPSGVSDTAPGNVGGLRSRRAKHGGNGHGEGEGGRETGGRLCFHRI